MRTHFHKTKSSLSVSSGGDRLKDETKVEFVDDLICARARPVMTGVDRENFRSSLSGRLYDFCTIRANALEAIDSRRVKMVDLVGVEPTISSMPWKLKSRGFVFMLVLATETNPQKRRIRRYFRPNLQL
jgi:hypothetical protein